MMILPPTGRHSRENGSILLMTLIALVVLSTILGTTLLVSANRYHAAWQASSWQEALSGAEAGADLAVSAVNTDNWTDWNVVAGAPPANGQPSGGANAVGMPTAGVYVWKTLTLNHPGEGNQRLAITMTIDAPASLAHAPGGQWLRVRATGTTDVPGPPRPSMERLDATLRKLSLVNDRFTGQPVFSPQVTRRIEVVLQPTQHRRAITLNKSIYMSGGVIDSFDSGDPLKSLDHNYDPTKRGTQGNVATLHSEGSDLNNVIVYGNLDYNGMPVGNTGGVRGTITPTFAEEMPVVENPDDGWQTNHPEITQVRGATVLVGGEKSNPARYKVSDFSVNNEIVTITPPAPGQESYVEIWVTGKLITAGTGMIIQLPGVHATYYVDGDIDIAGGSFVNRSNVAANMTVRGVTPADGSHRRLTITGDGGFIGVIEAPLYDFTISGSGDFNGALVGNTISMSKEAGVHYDEALNRQQTKYAAVSWYEDTR